LVALTLLLVNQALDTRSQSDGAIWASTARVGDWSVVQMPVMSPSDGPVDAVFKAIERMVNSGSTLLLYSVNAITTGSNSQGEVTVRLARDGRIVNGNGADTDIIVASAKAYLNALNKLQSGIVRLNPQLAA